MNSIETDGYFIGRWVTCQVWEILSFQDNGEGIIVDIQENKCLVDFGHRKVWIGTCALIPL